MKKHNRPHLVEDAKECIPPGIVGPEPMVGPPSDRPQTLMFDTLEAALKMEAAFWLERQFCYATKTTTRHWYQNDLGQMLEILKKHSKPDQTL